MTRLLEIPRDEARDHVATPSGLPNRCSSYFPGFQSKPGAGIRKRFQRSKSSSSRRAAHLGEDAVRCPYLLQLHTALAMIPGKLESILAGFES